MPDELGGWKNPGHRHGRIHRMSLGRTPGIGGCSRTGLLLHNSAGNLGWVETVASEIHTGLEVQLGDIRDSRFVDQACKDVEIVFHLAALIAIPYSYIATESFVDTNIRGTMNVLEGARRSGVGRIVHTSTSEECTARRPQFRSAKLIP